MKNLKIAEIVPVSCLDYTEMNQYHMCLAHLVVSDHPNSKLYSSFYRKMSDEGKYVLMDNGAAEGSQLDFDSLLYSYDVINPTEIVLPDSILDSQDTIAKSKLFYDMFKDRIITRKLMVVPQGKTFNEWCDCVKKLINCIPVNTIGVSKFLQMTTRDPEIRVKACEYLKDFDVEVHLLGCSEGPAVIKQARSVNERVRGCDSAFAYIAAKAGVQHVNIDTKRSEGEIDFLNDPVKCFLNVVMSEFEFTAGARYNFADETWEDHND